MKTFEAYGITWEILDEHYKAKDGIGILCVAKEKFTEMAFSYENDNYYATSDVRKFLEGLTAYIDNAGAEFLTVELDLTADDGTKKCESGIMEVRGFFLLTDQMYRDYRFDKETGEKLISNKNTPWWTATPGSFSSGYSYSARFVSTDGSLDYSLAYYGHLGVVPACVFAEIPSVADEFTPDKVARAIIDEVEK